MPEIIFKRGKIIIIHKVVTRRKLKTEKGNRV